jgi:diacylglycerol kinase (ATP)
MAQSADLTVVSCVIIANPAAGTITASILDDLMDRCGRHGPTRLLRTHRKGDGTLLARAVLAEPDDGTLRVVISVGGDGTTREVVEGVVGGGHASTRHALFIVPAGTGNSNYRAHWGETDWRTALDTALSAPQDSLRRLDVARFVERDRLVVLGAGAGLTADVLNLAPQSMKGRDRLRAGLELAALRFVPYPGRVTVDGVVLHEGATVFANAGGGRYRAWQYLILPHSGLDDGLLDVCVVGAAVPVAGVPALLRSGAHLSEPGVRYTRGRQVVIERTDGEPLCFEHDGELVADAGAKVTLEVVPAALPALCTPQPDDDRFAAPGAGPLARSAAGDA